jgi:hypothetical protein
VPKSSRFKLMGKNKKRVRNFTKKIKQVLEKSSIIGDNDVNGNDQRQVTNVDQSV